MTLTKTHIVEEVVKTGFAKKKSAQLVDTVLGIIKATLENGEDILISGFGKFYVKDKRKEEEEILKPGKIYFWSKEE